MKVLQRGLPLLLAALVLLPGCGGSSGADTAASTAAAAPTARNMDMGFSQMAVTEEAAVDDAAMLPAEAPEAESSADTGDFEIQARKIVRNSYLDLETKEFDQALAGIQQLVEQNGGYLESQSVNGRSLRDENSRQERYATLTARVPAENLDSVVTQVGELCNILSQSEDAQDITERYYDSQARLDSLTLQEERLLDILSKAEKLEDVIALESALSDVRYQIESLTASLRRMDSQVTYSFLHITLNEVVEYQEPAPLTFGDRLGRAVHRGGENLLDSCQGFLLFAAENLPSLLFWAVVLLAIVLVVRKLIRLVKGRFFRRREKTPPPLRPQGPAPKGEAPAPPEKQEHEVK